MSAGLLTSTCTPGRTAPDASLTTPAMLLCADAPTGSRRSPNDDAITSRAIRVRLIEPSSFCGREELDGLEGPLPPFPPILPFSPFSPLYAGRPGAGRVKMAGAIVAF